MRAPCVFIFSFFVVVVTAGSSWAPATSPLLLWTGRTRRDVSSGRVSFDFLGTQAKFTVSGATSVWATLNSTFWAAPPHFLNTSRSLQQSSYPKFGVYRVHVDGRRVSPPGHGGVVVLPGEAEYALATGLDPAAVHTVTLWYTTDAVDNSWPDLDEGRGCLQTVAGVRTDGSFAPPPPPRGRRMAILGDSITSGAAMYPPCSNATTCDASESYASLLCEAFSLNCTMLTASSKGLLHNCCDKLPVTVPLLANRTFVQDNTSAWAWGTAPPDAFFVNLGTNASDVFAPPSPLWRARASHLTPLRPARPSRTAGWRPGAARRVHGGLRGPAAAPRGARCGAQRAHFCGVGHHHGPLCALGGGRRCAGEHFGAKCDASGYDGVPFGRLRAPGGAGPPLHGGHRGAHHFKRNGVGVQSHVGLLTAALCSSGARELLGGKCRK